jgi:hypothetical protein
MRKIIKTTDSSPIPNSPTATAATATAAELFSLNTVVKLSEFEDDGEDEEYQMRHQERRARNEKEGEEEAAVEIEKGEVVVMGEEKDPDKEGF